MPRGIEEELAGLELSDDARSAFQRLIAQNRELAKASKAAAVDARIDELKGLGFADSPGALKVYRQVALADDEMPVIEFSDDDGTQHKPSAQELLDTFIGALTGGKQIAVQLSEQHTTSGNDNPPPAKDEAGETRSFEDRLAAAKSAIGAK